MNVQVSIQGDVSLGADEAAAQILELLGGDPDKDVCFVSIISTPTMGTAGLTVPPAPPPPEPE